MFVLTALCWSLFWARIHVVVNFPWNVAKASMVVLLLNFLTNMWSKATGSECQSKPKLDFGLAGTRCCFVWLSSNEPKKNMIDADFTLFPRSPNVMIISGAPCFCFNLISWKRLFFLLTFKEYQLFNYIM